MPDVTFAGWAATIGLIVVLLAIDLFVSRPRRAHTVGFREAAIASVFYVSVALAFGAAASAGTRGRSRSSSRSSSPSPG